jgi:hypothetical protein
MAMSRRKTIIFSVIILAVCFVLYTQPEQVQRDGEWYDVVTRLDAGAGRRITILKGTEPFEIPSWYYEITVGEQIVMPVTFLSGSCRSDRNAEYQLLISRDHEIVGVVCEKKREVLLVVHDFASGESWPRGEFDNSYEATLKRGRKLRDRLQKDHSERKLALSHEVP